LPEEVTSESKLSGVKSTAPAFAVTAKALATAAIERKVRDMVMCLFGINEYDFLSSVCGNANFIEFISNAKSGQFFFYSSDGKYMIKTMTGEESKFLRRILPHYFRHCVANPNTLLPRFFGMYRVKMYHIKRNTKFVIMNSVYDTNKYLDTFYDLKGSVTGRDAKPSDDVKKIMMLGEICTTLLYPCCLK